MKTFLQNQKNEKVFPNRTLPLFPFQTQLFNADFAHYEFLRFASGSYGETVHEHDVAGHFEVRYLRNDKDD